MTQNYDKRITPMIFQSVMPPRTSDGTVACGRGIPASPHGLNQSAKRDRRVAAA